MASDLRYPESTARRWGTEGGPHLSTTAVTFACTSRPAAPTISPRSNRPAIFVSLEER